jgi:hypothetical protein
MTPPRKLLSEIESVRANVRAAALGWDATAIPNIEAAATALECSLEPLRISLENHQISTPLPAAELRSAAQGLKKEAVALVRLVDAAAAFLRSSPAGLAGNNDAYTFAGELSPATAGPTESYAG